MEGDISLADLNEGTESGQSKVLSSFVCSDYSSAQYREDLQKFRKMALESQVQVSSEYSGLTNEYGQNPSGSSSEGQQTTQEMLQNVEKETEDVKKSS